jgi:hypothetical protein
MKRKILLSVLVLFAIAGCKKDNEKKEPCRVTKLITNGSKSYDISYGDDERISSMLNTSNNLLSSYKYKGDTTTITVTMNGNFQHRMIITNNSAGFATNVLTEENESGSNWYNRAFTYEGTRVVRNIVTDYVGNSDTAKYIWENGNPAVFIDEEGEVYNYEYYTDKKYQAGDWRYIQEFIEQYRIYECKNLLKSWERNNLKTLFIYNFDDAGRITEVTATSASTTYTIKTEYDCN